MPTATCSPPVASRTTPPASPPDSTTTATATTDHCRTARAGSDLFPNRPSTNKHARPASSASPEAPHSRRNHAVLTVIIESLRARNEVSFVFDCPIPHSLIRKWPILQGLHSLTFSLQEPSRHTPVAQGMLASARDGYSST